MEVGNSLALIAAELQADDGQTRSSARLVGLPVTWVLEPICPVSSLIRGRPEMLGSLDSVQLVVLRRSLIEPPRSHSIESAKCSACKETNS